VNVSACRRIGVGENRLGGSAYRRVRRIARGDELQMSSANSAEKSTIHQTNML
jgi:hypothetical protein